MNESTDASSTGRSVDIPEAAHPSRVILRRFTPDDFDHFAEFVTDPRVSSQFSLSEHQQGYAGAEVMLKHAIEGYLAKPPTPVFAIALRDKPDQCIGSCGFMPYGDQHVKCFYAISPAHWSMGYATEAAGVMLAWGFDHAGYDCINADVHAGNVASIRVAEKLGMRVEQQIQKDGRPGRRMVIDKAFWRKLQTSHPAS